MSFKIFIVTRNEPQHFALIDAIQDTKTLCGGVIQTDANTYMKKPQLEKLVNANKQSIHKYFGIKYSHMSNVKTLAITADEINNDNTVNFINNMSPDVVLFFDNEQITNENLSKINAKKWQLFMGNVEANRGYFSNEITNLQEKPELSSITLLEMSDNTDMGDIIHQSRASLREVDTVHDLQARSLRIMLNDIPEIVEHAKNNTLQTIKQNNTSVFNNQDSFTEDMLNTLFDKYNNKVYKFLVDNAENNELSLTEIKLFNVNASV